MLVRNIVKIRVMKNKYNQAILIIAMLVFCLLFAPDAMTSNYVKVAVIGTVPRVDKHQDEQKIVDQVIEFWKKELAQVLPDKPDLIVLTEACDRPAGMSTEEQFRYFRARGNRVRDFFASVAKEATVI